MQRWIPAALLVLALLAATFLYLNPTTEVRLSEQEIQAAVDDRLPLTGRKVGIEYEITRATVDLRQDGYIAVDAQMSASSLGISRLIEATGAGLLVYRNGSFYISGFSLEHVRFVEDRPRAPSRLAGVLNRLGVDDGEDFITARREDVLDKTRELGSGVLKSVFEQYPVQRLEMGNAKQWLLHLTLKDVRVENGALVATLDPLSAVLRILTIIAVIVLSLGAAVIFIRLGGLRLILDGLTN